VLWPVAIDSLLLLMAALLFNVSTRRRYPHHAPPAAAAPAPVGITAEDLHEALRLRGELLDVSEDDLRELFFDAETLSRRRRSMPN
jgi:CBS domain-containing membrane protein